MAKKPLTVFLSYAQEDVEVARAIRNTVVSAGYPVWDPECDIPAGSDFAAMLQRALDSAWAMIVIVSPAAMKSRWVTHEIEYALGAEHLRGRLIPVIARPAGNAPWILELLQPLRYQDPVKTGREIVEILKQPADVPKAKRTA